MFVQLLFLVTVLLCCYLYFRFSRDKVTVKNWNLSRDGIVVMKNLFTDEQVHSLKEEVVSGNYESVQSSVQSDNTVAQRIQETLGPSYQFQDYVWVIQKSAVHTCHRDNNGDFFNKGQKHPSYTMLVYLEDMPSAFGFIPESHLKENRYEDSLNLVDPLVHIQSKKGDAILFNANLIHVGTIDEKDDHPRIQMKVTHKDDRETLEYYENFHKVLNRDNTVPKWLRKAQKHVSCMVPIVSDLTQEVNKKSARGSDNGASIPFGQKLFSSLYYGDSNFYDLPNAF